MLVGLVDTAVHPASLDHYGHVDLKDYKSPANTAAQ